VDVRKFTAGKHGREPFAQRNGIGCGQNRVIAPHAGRASGQTRRGESAFYVGKVVAGVKNSTVFGAHGLRAVGGIVLPAASAFQMSQHCGGEFSRGAAAVVSRRAVISILFTSKASGLVWLFYLPHLSGDSAIGKF